MTKFHYEGITQRNEDYVDFEFIDDDPRHLYWVFWSSSSKDWSGVHRISETDDGDYTDDFPMNPADIAHCVSLIPPHALECCM